MHFFFFNDTATTEIYTLSLHDALPISQVKGFNLPRRHIGAAETLLAGLHCERKKAAVREGDRKSTRLNSSHVRISYAVFCLKKKKKLQLIKEIVLVIFLLVNLLSLKLE